MHPLAEQLLKSIRKQDSIRPGDRLAVAVSGGADSVALVILLVELKADLGIVLSVAHVNHKLRGEESDEDERFVAQLAKQHELEFHLREAPAALALAVDGQSNGQSNVQSNVEASARQLRYSFFTELARQNRVTKIATAHTLDDQAETVLLRMFRGTGIRGLSAIHPRIVLDHSFSLGSAATGSDLGTRAATIGEVVRPLLAFRHAALREYLRERAQNWREDSSNQNVGLLRNRVRHRLLPIIAEEFGDSAIEHMSELAEIARAEEQHWRDGHPEVRVEARAEVTADARADARQESKTEVHEEVFGLDRGSPETRPAASLQTVPLLALSLAAQRRRLRAWLDLHAPNVGISFRLIEQALELARAASDGEVSKRLELSGGISLLSARQELLLELAPPPVAPEALDYEYVLPVPGVVQIPELGASIEASVVQPAAIPEEDRGQLLYLGRMPKQVVIRNWRAGDRFWPAHTAEEKKVKELLSDRHAAGMEKKLWPVALAEGCGIIWLRGFPVPAAYRAPMRTPKAIWIREITGMM